MKKRLIYQNKLKVEKIMVSKTSQKKTSAIPMV